MPTAEKEQSVLELKAKIDRASAVILTEYRGLKAQDMDRLRRSFRQAGLEYRVVKNTILRRAAAGTSAEAAAQDLGGPIAVLFAYEDPVAAAKTLAARVQEYEALIIKCGVFDRQFCPKADIEAIARLPGRQEMLGKAVATIQSPITNLVLTLQNVVQRLAGTLHAYAAKSSQE